MSNRTSYENHNREYKELKAIVRERAAHTQHNSEEFKFIYQDDIPHGEVLDSHTFTTAIDIGSGTVSSITAGEYIVKVAHFTALNGGRYLWSKKETITVD